MPIDFSFQIWYTNTVIKTRIRIRNKNRIIIRNRKELIVMNEMLRVKVTKASCEGYVEMYSVLGKHLYELLDSLYRTYNENELILDFERTPDYDVLATVYDSYIE